jgi:hypothetical protein
MQGVERMKIFSSCSKLLAACFAIAFLISALITLLLFNIQSHYLDPETYKAVMDEQEIYNRLPEILARQITYSMTYNPCLENPEQCEGEEQGEGDEGGPPPYLRNLNQEDWEFILSKILTPEWTQLQAESIFEQFFAFLVSGEERLTITISLVELKASLTGEEGMLIIEILVNAQPPCTETLLGALVDMVAGDFSPEQLLMCRPPEAIMDGLTPTLEAALNLVIDDLPDQVTIGKTFFHSGEGSSSLGQGEGPGITFQTLQRGMQLSPLLALTFLVLLTLFGVRSLRDFLFWWGIPFLATGITALGLGLTALPLMEWGLNSFVLERIPGGIDPALMDILLETLELLVKSLVHVVANQAAVIAILGLGLTGAGLTMSFLSERSKQI